MEFENLITLINTVSDSTLTGFKYEENGVKIQLTKKEGKVKVIAAPEGTPSEPSPATAPKEMFVEAKADQPGNMVKSPLVGTFYTAPAEDADPFVKVGDTVKKGQILAIVEAMKLMNEIESDFEGKIAEVLVENGQPVEYGQPLFRIV